MSRIIVITLQNTPGRPGVAADTSLTNFLSQRRGMLDVFAGFNIGERSGQLGVESDTSLID